MDTCTPINSNSSPVRTAEATTNELASSPFMDTWNTPEWTNDWIPHAVKKSVALVPPRSTSSKPHSTRRFETPFDDGDDLFMLSINDLASGNTMNNATSAGQLNQLLSPLKSNTSANAATMPHFTNVPTTPLKLPEHSAAFDHDSPLLTSFSSQLPLSQTAHSSFKSTELDPQREREDLGTWRHALVVFDKMFNICFVPAPLRSIMKVGELVLCEWASGENIGTVVADVTTLIATVMKDKSRSLNVSGVDLQRTFTPAVDRYPNLNTSTTSLSSNSGVNISVHAIGAVATALYKEKPQSGLPADDQLCRLPCVLCRGTNRDKKRVYFSRLRSNDALATVQRAIVSEPITALGAGYQVNFACATVYLAGERWQTAWTPRQFEQLGASLVEPLRCETVEFRFCSEYDHTSLDLTRAIVGEEHSEELYEKVAEWHKHQNGKSVPAAQRTSLQSGNNAKPHPPSLSSYQGHAELLNVPHPSSGGSPRSTTSNRVPSQAWSQSDAVLSGASYASFGSLHPTMASSFLYAQPQQAPSPPQQQQQISYVPAAYQSVAPPHTSPVPFHQHRPENATNGAMAVPMNVMPGSSFYYMLPQHTSAAVPWPTTASLEPPRLVQCATQPQLISSAQAMPSYVCAGSSSHIPLPTQQVQPQTVYVQLSAVQTNGCAYPFMPPPTTMSFPSFQQ